MSLAGTKCTRLVLIFCNVIFSWISGGLLVLFGGASLYEPSYLQFHTLLTVDRVPQYVFILFALSIIALGGFIITLGLFGCFGLLCDNNCIIKTYIYLLIFVFVAELGLAVGSFFMFFTFPSMSPDLKEDLVDMLKTDYGYPTHHAFNTAMGYSQSTLHCCGLNNYSDYELSAWGSMASHHSLKIPLTCCSTIPISQSWRNVENATALDVDIHDHHDHHDHDSTEAYFSSTESSSSWAQKCQSGNPMESDDYLYAQGCWSLVEEIYLRHALFTGILFASLALLQIVGFIIPICWLRKVERSQKEVRIRTRQAQAQPLL